MPRQILTRVATEYSMSVKYIQQFPRLKWHNDIIKFNLMVSQYIFDYRPVPSIRLALRCGAVVIVSGSPLRPFRCNKLNECNEEKS